MDDIEEDVRGASAQTLGKLVRLVAVPANDLVAPLIRSLSDREPVLGAARLLNIEFTNGKNAPSSDARSPK